MRLAKNPSEKKLTLVDVARVAGVSAITVSRVINQPAKVSESVRIHVQSVIESMGYIPNQYASSLASSRSRVIGVSIPSLSNIVFTDVLRGIYDVMAGTDYKVLLVDTNYSSQEEEKMVRTLLAQAPEAMIITGGDQTKTCEQLLRNSKIPIVQMMELLPEPMDMNIGFSHYQAGYDVAVHLLQQGCERIGFIGARMDERAQRRLEGFKYALGCANKYSSHYMVTTSAPSSIEMGEKLFKDLLAATEGAVDSIFCVNDDLALGVLFESQRMNIKVPDQLAVCGFNDIETSQFVNPSLTSVHVGRYEMGVKAAQMIVARLKGDAIVGPIVDIGYTIKKRLSTAR